mmetsp:Transcript_48270/g.115002  ORF Transcript_48270/g.115002 Transcript_48270/m.115002 type:complete len:250 (+) Transcript_48270:49-798(+)
MGLRPVDSVHGPWFSRSPNSNHLNPVRRLQGSILQVLDIVMLKTCWLRQEVDHVEVADAQRCHHEKEGQVGAGELEAALEDQRGGHGRQPPTCQSQASTHTSCLCWVYLGRHLVGDDEANVRETFDSIVADEQQGLHQSLVLGVAMGSHDKAEDGAGETGQVELQGRAPGRRDAQQQTHGQARQLPQRAHQQLRGRLPVHQRRQHLRECEQTPKVDHVEREAHGHNHQRDPQEAGAEDHGHLSAHLLQQ